MEKQSTTPTQEHDEQLPFEDRERAVIDYLRTIVATIEQIKTKASEPIAWGEAYKELLDLIVDEAAYSDAYADSPSPINPKNIHEYEEIVANGLKMLALIERDSRATF